MNLFFDECLSPLTALELFDHGHYSVHPRNQGGTGDSDHKAFERARRENLAVVTENALDYRKLAARAEIHPGVIILPCETRERSKTLLLAAIEYLAGMGEPNGMMVNHILEVGTADGGRPMMNYYQLSA